MGRTKTKNALASQSLRNRTQCVLCMLGWLPTCHHEQQVCDPLRRRQAVEQAEAGVPLLGDHQAPAGGDKGAHSSSHEQARACSRVGQTAAGHSSTAKPRKKVVHVKS